MSFLGSLFSSLFGWVTSLVSSWFSRNDYYDAMDTTSGTETLAGTDDGEKYVISGSVKASDSGTNVIDMGAGDDTLSILGALESEHSNQVLLGEGDNSFKVSGSVLARETGENEITAGAGDDALTITGKLSAADDGHNYVNLGDGDNTVSVTLGLSAADTATNNVETGSGDDTVCITFGMSADGGTNSVDLGDGDNSITIRGGLTADNDGSNLVQTGSGDDFVSIWGISQASDGGFNSVATGSGNDTISLHNTIAEGGLLIDAGAGDDVLVLNGSRTSTFNNAYEDWLNDYADEYGLESMNVGTFEVTMTRTAGGLADLEWLKDLTDDAAINLQLNVDANGRALKLGSFFAEGEADVFSILSMEGGTKNTLTINGSLADNGYDGDQLVILGNDDDTVKLGSEWTEVAAQDVEVTLNADLSNYDFNYYQNADDGTLLLIQNGINFS